MEAEVLGSLISDSVTFPPLPLCEWFAAGKDPLNPFDKVAHLSLPALT